MATAYNQAILRNSVGCHLVCKEHANKPPSHSVRKLRRYNAKGSSVNKLHIAIATDNIEASIKDYTVRLGVAPCSSVANEYALWRTESLNVSIRQDLSCKPGELRHLGWEDSSAKEFSQDTDVNGIAWERFSAQQKADEINEIWAEAKFIPE